jgi:Tfp pilus assembly protein PilO
MKLTKEKKQNLLLTILVITGLIYGVWYFLIDRQGRYAERDTNEKDRLEKEIKDTEIAIKRETNNREQAKVFQVYIQTAESQMPKGTVDAWLLKELSDIAAKNHLTLDNTLLQPLKALSDFKMKGQPYELAGFHMDIKGEFNQIGSFIQEMENKMPMVEINDISITSGSEAAPYIHTVSMTVCVCLQRKI